MEDLLPLPKNSKEWNNWIKDAINKGIFKYFNYNEFSNFEEIGSGRFAEVYRAYWKNHYFALKYFYKFDDNTVKEIARELKIHNEVELFNNIIRFHGITSHTQDIHNIRVEKYYLMMEYADDSTLKNYLKNNFNTLTWDRKFVLAHQLASAVSYLHNIGVVHRDLHSDNVLVHQGIIKLADFGLSKRIDEGTRFLSRLFGVIPYMDPKGNTYKDDNSKKSYDIFSLGVLLWEISSGHPPFMNTNHDQNLMVNIANGQREAIVCGTPDEYSKLYTECWDHEPNNRPTISQVVERLEKIIFKAGLNQNQFGVINDQQSHECLSYASRIQFAFQSENSNMDIDIQDDVEIIGIQIDGIQYVSVKLNLNDKLSNIRESLKQLSLKIQMNDTLSFAKNKLKDYRFDEIGSDDEEKILLGEIINIEDKILYLTRIDMMDVDTSDDEEREIANINKLLDKYKIKRYNSQDIKILKVTESGESALIYAAYWKNVTKFAIKKFIKASNKEIINEINLMRITSHPNIQRFYGVTELDKNSYSLVLEYADGGILEKYLENNSKWETRLKFANDIAQAILFLHEENIIHGNLNPKNILVHQNTAILASLECSRLQGSDFNDSTGRYELTKKTDIYSLGKIFRELISCLSNKNTEFVALYNKCCQCKPNERPNIHEVILELRNVSQITSSHSENDIYEFLSGISF